MQVAVEQNTHTATAVACVFAGAAVFWLPRDCSQSAQDTVSVPVAACKRARGMDPDQSDQFNSSAYLGGHDGEVLDAGHVRDAK